MFVEVASEYVTIGGGLNAHINQDVHNCINAHKRTQLSERMYFYELDKSYC